MQRTNSLKALILCAGKGTRLQPLTYSRPKQLIPVANKPILHHAIEQVVHLGIRDIGIVVSPQNHEAIFESSGKGSLWSASINYIQQPQPLGIAHAVKIARNFLEDANFLLYLGDNLIQGKLDTLLEKFRNNSADACILLKEVDDPRRFGVATIDKKGNITKLVEKPTEPPSKNAVLGIYFFTPQIHKAIEKIKPSWRGELEITDSIQQLISSGKKVISQIHEGWWLDTGKKEDILRANAFFLDEVAHSIAITPDDHTQIDGDMEIGGGTYLEKCQLVGPLSIGKDCLLRQVHIGPYVSIGHGSHIENCTAVDSIIMEGSHVRNVNLKNSILGSRVTLVAAEGMQNSLTTVLGNDAIVEM